MTPALSTLSLYASARFSEGPRAQLEDWLVPELQFTTVTSHTSLPSAAHGVGAPARTRGTLPAELMGRLDALHTSSSSDGSPESKSSSAQSHPPPTTPPSPTRATTAREPLIAAASETPEFAVTPPTKVPELGSGRPQLSVRVGLHDRLYSTDYCDVYCGTMTEGGIDTKIMVKVCDPRRRPGGLEVLREEAQLYTTLLEPLQGTAAPRFYGYHEGHHLEVSVAGKLDFHLGVLLHEDVGMSLKVFCQALCDVGPYCRAIRAAYDSVHKHKVAEPVGMDVHRFFTRLRRPSSEEEWLEWYGLGYWDDGPLPDVEAVCFADFERAVTPAIDQQSTIMGLTFEECLELENDCVDKTLAWAADIYARGLTRDD